MKHSTGIVKKLGAHLVNHIASGVRIACNHVRTLILCVFLGGIEVSVV